MSSVRHCEILVRTTARVVVISSWRRKGRGIVGDCLGSRGTMGTAEVDVTPDLFTGPDKPGTGNRGPRGKEVASWLMTNCFSLDAAPSMVILDDFNDFESLIPWLCHCDGSVGITRDDVEKCVTLLRKPGPRLKLVKGML